MSGGWGSAGSGGGGKKKSKPAPRDPQKELFRALGRALEAKRNMPSGQTLDPNPQIEAALRGLSPGMVRRAGRNAELESGVVAALVERSRDLRRAPVDDGGGIAGILANPVGAGRSMFTKTLYEASRPVQATTSAVAEWSRQGEKNPIQVGPLSLRFGIDDPGAILRSAKEGFEHKRHDSPVTIAMEAGKIRAKQGVGTESFGVVPGTDLRTGQALPGGIAGKMTYDVGGSIALDPLTYLTFGTGSAARQGLAATSRTLGAERAAEIARLGPRLLTAEEKLALGDDVLRRLRGVKPGVAVRVPQPIRAVRRGENLLAPPRTVISAGPVVRAGVKGAEKVADTRLGGLVERAFVPRAGVKQAERRGRLAPGTADELDRMRVEFASGADASQDLQYLAYVKRTHKLSDDETEALMWALETSPDGLTPKVRGAYDDIDEYRRALAEEKRAAGVLSSAYEVQRKREAGVVGKYAPQHTRAEKALNRVLVKLRAQQQKVDDAARRLEAAKAEAEFVSVPAVNRPAGMGPAHHVREDQVLVRKVGEARTALAREQTKLRVLANTAKSAENRALAIVGREQRALARLPGTIPDEQYVPHIEVGTARAREAEKRAQIMGGGGPSVTARDPGFARRREIEGTVFDANAAGQSFETDPFLAFARHAPEARRAIATRKFVDDALQMVDTDGVPLLRPVEQIPDMTDELLEEAGLTKIKIPREGEFVVDKALAPELKKVARLAAGDETTSAFLRGVDRWMTLWKGYATVPLPFGVGFHMRNGTSNVMLNWLADINPVDPAYVQAWRMQRAVSKGMKEGDGLKYLTGTQREVAEAALGRDVIGGAFFIEDLPPDLMRPFKSRAARIGEAVNPVDPGNLLIRGGRKVGIEIEENARLAHFIAKYREFGNFDDAAASVRKYLFDYGDLTAFEKDVMKRIMPFYCVPTDAECLTRRGWKRHDELIEGEDVLVLDPQTHEYRWEPLLEVARFDFDGDLAVFEQRTARFRFTEDHRWPYETGRTVVNGKVYGGERGVKPASELNTNHKIPLTGRYGGEGSLDLSPRLAAILGWVVTDGYHRKRGNHHEMLVYQSPGKHLDEIVALLGTTPRKPHPISGVVPVGVARDDVRALTKHYETKSDLPSLVTLLSPEAAEAMWDAMFKAEGSSSETFDHFAQVPGPVLDAFQILSTMLGKSATIGPRGAYVKRRTAYMKVGNARRDPEHYEGIVWCPRTPTGTWVMRQGGAVIPTGNTFTRKNTPLWIAAAFKQPGKYSRLAEWQRAFIDVAGGYPEGAIPQYLEDQAAVPIPGVQVGGNPVLLSPDLPPIAASEVVTPLMQLAALVPGADKVGLKKNPEGIEAALRPLFSQTGGGPIGAAKALYDVTLGTDSFTGRPFYDGQNVEAPIYMDPLAPLGLHNPLIPKRDVDGEQVPAIDRRAQYLAESLLPMLPKVRSLVPTSPQDEDKQVRRGLSILTGVQAYPLGEATQRSELFRRVEILRRYLAGLAARGIDVPDAPPTRSQSSGW